MAEEIGGTHKQTVGARASVPITDNNSTHGVCKGVYIGVDGDYDFFFGAAANSAERVWVEFKGCVAGTQLSLQVTGARDASDNSAPAAGEINFYYD